MKLKNNVLLIVVASLYTVLSLTLGSFSFMVIQFRYAEILNILCLKDKRYIYAVTLGCFITNLLGVLVGINPLGYIDAFLGTLATFIAGYLMYELRDIYWFKKPILALSMPAIINGLIIGAELAFILSYQTFLKSFVIYAFWVFISELIIVLGFGLLIKDPLFKFLERK